MFNNFSVLCCEDAFCAFCLLLSTTIIYDGTRQKSNFFESAFTRIKIFHSFQLTRHIFVILFHNNLLSKAENNTKNSKKIWNSRYMESSIELVFVFVFWCFVCCSDNIRQIVRVYQLEYFRRQQQKKAFARLSNKCLHSNKWAFLCIRW